MQNKTFMKGECLDSVCVFISKFCLDLGGFGEVQIFFDKSDLFTERQKAEWKNTDLLYRQKFEYHNCKARIHTVLCSVLTFSFADTVAFLPPRTNLFCRNIATIHKISTEAHTKPAPRYTNAKYVTLK